MYLNCHSWFSLRYGTLSPEQLVNAAAECGAKTLALTDINNTSCAFEFVTRCRAKGIKPVLGVEFREGTDLHFIGLAKNNEGFRQLCTLLTEHSVSNKPIPLAPRKRLDNCFIIYPKLIKDISSFKEHEFLGIRPEHASKLYGKAVLKAQR